MKQRRWVRRAIASFLFPAGYIVSYINGICGYNLLIKIFVTDLIIFDGIIALRLQKLLPEVLNNYFSTEPEFLNNDKTEFMVLKRYVSDNEKGVVSIHWRWYVDILVRNYDINKIIQNYMLILEIDCFGAEWSFPFVFLMTTHRSDSFVVIKDTNSARRLSFFGSNLISYGLACDYINKNQFVFCPDTYKEIDVLMIAHWHVPTKRHFVLFRALKKINTKLNVVLCGFESGGYTYNDVKQIEKFYNLKRHNIKYYDNILPEEINKLLNKSKCTVLTSLMEGSNRACFESIFANVPVITLSNNYGIPKEYINKQTGIITNERKLHKTIEYMIDNYSDFSPREWAMNNITPELTMRKINDYLKEYSIRNGMCWTEDIVAKQWHGNKFQYVDMNVQGKYKYDYSFIDKCFMGKC